MGVFVSMECVGMGDLRVDPADGKVHLRQPPSGVVGLLAVDGDVAELAAVDLDELLAANEHAARAAARVIHAAFVWGEHFDQDSDDTRGRIELAAFLALCAGEPREEILIYLAQDVLCAVGRASKAAIAP